MRNLLAATLLIASSAFAQEIPNPAIDMPGYLRISEEAASVRRACRVTEDEFLRIASQPGAVILDARSSEKYREMHVRGAVNLSFPDFTAANLQRVIPTFDTPVLIYCNNNFTGAEGPFPGKMATASLNLSTYIALYTYGFRNVYELGPLVDVRDSRLEFEGERASRPHEARVPRGSQ